MTKRDDIPAGPSLRALLLVGALGFLLAGLVFAPASLVRPALANLGAPVTYKRIDGTLWRGRIEGLTISDQYIGNATFAAAPLNLLLGRLSARVEVEGGVGDATGDVSFGIFGRSMQVSGAEIVFNLSAIKRYTFFGVPYQGDVRASVDRLAWTPKGCRAAKARVWTDLLDASSRQILGDGLELAGTTMCDGDRLRAALSGQNSEGSVIINVALTPDMTYEFVAYVEPREESLQEDLKRLGFEDNDGQLVYDAIGAIKGLGS